MEKIATPFEQIKVEKPVGQRRATTEEDAAVVALVAAGGTERSVAEQLGHNPPWVHYRKKKMAAEIAYYRQMLLEEHEDTFTEAISLYLYRIREQLAKDKVAGEIPNRDLSVGLKNVVTCHQALKKKVPVPGPVMLPIPAPEDGEEAPEPMRHPMDSLAIADQFNRNFEALQRAAIAAMSKKADVEMEEGDFVDCPPD
jgi:hypothetical protein